MEENTNKKIPTWTVLASTENVRRIKSKISVDELQDLFKPDGLALKIDDTFDGPFIGFYSIKFNEITYFTPSEFVECCRGDLWGAQRDYRLAKAEYERQHPEIRMKREMEEKQKQMKELAEKQKAERRHKKKRTRGIS